MSESPPGTEQLTRLTAKIQRSIIGTLAISGLVLVGLFAVIQILFAGAQAWQFILLTALWLASCIPIGWLLARRVTRPLSFLSQAILHISPTEHSVAAPHMENLRLGRELITTLVDQLYGCVGTPGTTQLVSPGELILQQIPLPLVGLDSQLQIVFANPLAEHYSQQATGLVGKNVYNGFEMSFADSGDNLDTWLQSCRASSVTAQKSWERVRLQVPGQARPSYFDLSASYSQHNPSGSEVMLVFFDHTDSYSMEDTSISFIALAVHELRTPLTVLRGYIEAMGEELEGKLTPETMTFMQRMEASAESLSGFVSNILNVAHIDQDSLALQLREENWTTLLERTVADMRVRAKVHNISIELKIAPDIPPVAADRISIAEVINNLLDNAIKYSHGKSQHIFVKSGLNTEGLVETTIQDFGVGIPSEVMPTLFEKFARNHRNRAAISGTGLGLYLSKALVSAHQGNLWVRSHEGKGSIFGFTLLPYAKLAETDKSSDTKNITTHPHGWIKNHSMTRH